MTSLEYSRIILYPDATNIEDAAKFLVYSLLISHGIRRDVLAEVKLGEKWIIAPGNRIRHLRPDADTSEGWIKAVLRGRKLGAEVRKIPLIPNTSTNLLVKLTNKRELLSLPGRVTTPVLICLTRSHNCELPVEFKQLYSPYISAWRTIAIINIFLDRFLNNLPVLPC